MYLQNPVRAIDLPGVFDLELQGLIVVVGPNSSGKTQLLHDLNETVCGRSRQLVVVSAIAFKTPPLFEEYFEFLIDRGSIRESAPNQFLMRSLQYGADEGGGGSFHKSNLQSQYQQFSNAAQSKVEGREPENFRLSTLGAQFASATPPGHSPHFLDRRAVIGSFCLFLAEQTEDAH